MEPHRQEDAGDHSNGLQGHVLPAKQSGRFHFVARFAGNEEFDSSKAVKEFNL